METVLCSKIYQHSLRKASFICMLTIFTLMNLWAMNNKASPDDGRQGHNAVTEQGPGQIVKTDWGTIQLTGDNFCFYYYFYYIKRCFDAST